MSDLKAFSPNLKLNSTNRWVAVMEPDVDGGWVAYPDWLDMRAERDRLAEELKASQAEAMRYAMAVGQACIELSEAKAATVQTRVPNLRPSEETIQYMNRHLNDDAVEWVRLGRVPAAVPEVDTEVIAWAYDKLKGYGAGGHGSENEQLMRRLLAAAQKKEGA